jgi:hypothetical protein
MNKDAIFSFAKKNMLSLVCGVVAILAVAATFYPLGDMVTTLHDSANTVAQDYNTLTGFTKPRNMPTTDPTNADPGKLTGFPNQATVTWGQNQNARLIKTSQDVLHYVQEANQKGHEPVVAGAFAPTSPQSVLFAFAKTYALVLTTDPTISGLGDPSANPPLAVDPTLHASAQVNLQNDILHGGLPPTLEEIKTASTALWTDKYQPMIILKNGVPVNQLELQTAYNTEVATLPLKMKHEAAKKHKIYVEKDAFTVNPAIPPHDPPKPDDMWYAQLQLWMQRDLATAIAEENAKSTSILDSPVKRLISMYMPAASMYVFPPASAAGGAGGQPGMGGVPAAAKDTDPIPPIYSVSPTGRYSNGMYDVLAFRLTVDVDASKVNEFIETLSHQRFITVNIQNEYALDANTESARGYLYGSNATVRLVLDGEMLFMRSWTFDMMPERVKQALGLIPGATPAGMPAGGGGGPGGGNGMPPGMPGMPGMPPQR